MIYIFDASALVAYLRDEPGADLVESILTNPTHQNHVHAVNLCEVFYDAHRSFGEPAAVLLLDQLVEMGLAVHGDLTTTLWQAAGRIKAVHRRVSLADCFAIALANSLGGAVLTCDHHEFDAVAGALLCPVTFIR